MCDNASTRVDFQRVRSALDPSAACPRTMWLEYCANFFGVQFSERTFAAKFGCSTEVCNYVYARVRGQNLSCKELLMTLNFLKCYNTFDAAYPEWGCCRRQYIYIIQHGLEVLGSSLNEVLYYTA